MEAVNSVPGEFCWVDVQVNDAARAKAFYGGLFGWEAVDIPMGESGIYTILKLHGQDVAALYEHRESGAPPHWACYILVTNIEETCAKVASLGGELVMGPFDVSTSGRMAVVRDPQGAIVQLWQAGQHTGFGARREVGAICWTELMTTDIEAAKSFYGGLVGWTSEPFGGHYVVFKLGDKTVAGGMNITPDMGPVPPNWMPYVQVADCDSAAAKAGTLGARTLVSPQSIPDVGRFAVLQDPDGAVFGVLG